jgi:hypothetical protein
VQYLAQDRCLVTRRLGACHRARRPNGEPTRPITFHGRPDCQRQAAPCSVFACRRHRRVRPACKGDQVRARHGFVESNRADTRDTARRSSRDDVLRTSRLRGSISRIANSTAAPNDGAGRPTAVYGASWTLTRPSLPISPNRAYGLTPLPASRRVIYVRGRLRGRPLPVSRAGIGAGGRANLGRTSRAGPFLRWACATDSLLAHGPALTGVARRRVCGASRCRGRRWRPGRGGCARRSFRRSTSGSPAQ